MLLVLFLKYSTGIDSANKHIFIIAFKKCLFFSFKSLELIKIQMIVQ